MQQVLTRHRPEAAGYTFIARHRIHPKLTRGQVAAILHYDFGDAGPRVRAQGLNQRQIQDFWPTTGQSAQ